MTSTHINDALATGRQILALERQLATLPPGDPHRADLGTQHAKLMRRQQEQLVAAHCAGADWDTIRFALTLHGQHAGREVGSTEATPAEQLLDLLRQFGGTAVIATMNALGDIEQASSQNLEVRPQRDRSPAWGASPLAAG